MESSIVGLRKENAFVIKPLIGTDFRSGVTVLAVYFSDFPNELEHH